MLSIVTLIIPCVLAYLIIRYRNRKIEQAVKEPEQVVRPKIPVSVNYHFTRLCNKSCGFCFHVSKTSFMLSEEKAKEGLKLLKEAGMRKINFAGGEPFVKHKFLAKMLEYCKKDLQIESVSIVSNGSLITESFIKQYAKYIDVLAISCDSFNEQTNIDIGRGSGDNVKKLFEISKWCKEYDIKFKLNTVVCLPNYQENMVSMIEKLQPFRWKCFQVLMVQGENDSEKAKGDMQKFQISDEQYELFRSRHEGLSCFVPEPNNVMASSYLILDEYMRFLDKGDGQEIASETIFDVGVSKALSQVRWDEQGFNTRGGIYDWSKDKKSGCGTGSGTESGTGCQLSRNKNLEW